jgi:hypothetical protein
MDETFPLTEIPRTPVDANAIRAYVKESEHMRLGFDLLRETSLWSVVLGSAYAGEVRPWNKVEAILGGHLLRLSKLLRAFLEQSRDDRGEIGWISTRLTIECIINFRFLLLHHSDEAVITSYLHQSLQHERDLRESIERNIKDRGGRRLPIESRMLRSIDRTFSNSEVRPEDLPRRRIQNWGRKNLREKARELDIEHIYEAFITGASRNVHGSWHDLLQHHLEVASPGRFLPKFKDARVRPQIFHALITVIVPALVSYVEFLGTVETAQLQHRLEELRERVATANRLHEEFLTAKQLLDSDSS